MNRKTVLLIPLNLNMQQRNHLGGVLSGPQSEINIKICNWNKYQKENSKHFIRIENNHFMDPKIQSLTNYQYRLYIALLCLAGTQNRGGDITSTSQIIGFATSQRSSAALRSLDKLLELQLIENTDKRDKIREEKEIFEETFSSPPKIKFLTKEKAAEIYEKYPLKKGKTKGVEKLQKIIKCENDLKKFNTALNNYCLEIKQNKTEPKFIKHFSTFVNNWEDYLEPQTSKRKNSMADLPPPRFD